MGTLIMVSASYPLYKLTIHKQLFIREKISIKDQFSLGKKGRKLKEMHAIALRGHEMMGKLVNGVHNNSRDLFTMQVWATQCDS